MDQGDGTNDSRGLSAPVAALEQGEIDDVYDTGFQLVRQDLGDLPINLPSSPNYPTLYEAGASHILFPDGGDNIPDSLGSVVAVWLGTIVDDEADGQPSVLANGDDVNDESDDEDGVEIVGSLLAGGTGTFNITLNSSAPTVVTYGLWLDWNNDGVFDDFYSGAVTTTSPVVDTVLVDVPADWTGTLYYRTRAFGDGYVPTADDYQGTWTNGEVEDYLEGSPTAVTLRDAMAVNDESLTRVALLVSIMVMTLVTVRVVRRREQS